MHTLILSISPDGPLVPVEIGLDTSRVQQLRQAGRPIQAPIAAQGLLDSGAEMTCVDPAIITALLPHGIQPKRIIPVNAPALGGFHAAMEYQLNLTILHPSGDPKTNLVLRDHTVLEQDIGTLGYQCLIGRDVLDLCVFLYDGPSRNLTLGY